ncbi:MAG TPA: hypothetical protein VF762_04410 [Blastocatellia bacterium]
MAKKRKTERRKEVSPPQPEPEIRPGETSDGKDRRKKMRALIMSTLAAGGVFQMNSWQIQAHGNRSSHTTLAFQTPYIAPDDYTLMRASMTTPNLADANELSQLIARLNSLQTAGTITGDSTEYQSLTERKEALAQQVGTPGTTREVIQFLRQGDVDGAIAAIEGQGWPERVLTEYEWTLLDISYLSNDQLSTAASRQADFLAIARPAAAYAERVLALTGASPSDPREVVVRQRAAEVLHNIASFIVLSAGVDNASLSFGQQSAERALQIRIGLNDPATIMRANWMVAQYHIRANRTAEALDYLQTSLQQAQQLGNQAGILWAKFSMAKALRASQPQQAGSLEAEVRQGVDSFAGQDTTIDFLRLELRQG